MVDYSTQPKVREAAAQFRKDHDALDWSASVDDLIALKGYTQDKWAVHRPLNVTSDWLTAEVQKASKKVRALVSVREKLILVASDLSKHRVPFAKAHEVGHTVLPWHQAILYVCDEQDLAADTQAQLEFEANAFASELLLPKELLQPIYAQFETTFETVMLVAQKSGASIEASAYAYVKYHPGICALAVLEELKPKTPEALFDPRSDGLRLVRKSLSSAAVATPLGSLTPGQTFSRAHVLYAASRDVGTVNHTEIYLGDVEDNVRYEVAVKNTSFKVLALMTEKKK